MSFNPEDDKREKILKFLYARHKNTKGITKIPIGIRELQKEMRQLYELKQQDVSSNLDYLIQVGWVRDVTKERKFKTKGGMELSQEQIKYKISDVGINHLESGTVFKKSQISNLVNITNIKGITIIGDGNIVNAEFAELSRALDQFEKEIAVSKELSDEQKLDASGDLSTIRTQIAKKNPNILIIKKAWESLKAFATISSIVESAIKVGTLISELII
jgi:hypothetical protein